MKYSVHESEIKTGDILGWTHREWKSWYDFQIQIVRMFTKSEFSHVGIAYWEDNKLYVIEAIGSGVRKSLLSENIPFYWIKAEPLSEKAISFAKEQIGRRYESKIKMVINYFWDLDLENNKRWQCSELVNAIYRVNKTPLTFIDEPSKIMQVCWEKYNYISYIGE